MLNNNVEHGFSKSEWEAAKEEARAAMITRAKKRGMLTYSELVNKIDAITLEPHDLRLFHMLGEISAEEDAAGRGMLTVLVVHKTGDMEPGKGFYELAKTLNKKISDPTSFWIKELHKVHSYWSN